MDMSGRQGQLLWVSLLQFTLALLPSELKGRQHCDVHGWSILQEQ